MFYVLEGTWEYTLDGKPPLVVMAGDTLFIPAGVIHSAKNVGTGNGAELATYVVEKGETINHAGEVSARDGESSLRLLGRHSHQRKSDFD